MLKCDYITLEYEGRYIPFWNLTLRELSLSVASFDERSLEHDPSVSYNRLRNVFILRRRRSPQKGFIL